MSQGRLDLLHLLCEFCQFKRKDLIGTKQNQQFLTGMCVRYTTLLAYATQRRRVLVPVRA